jgi:hypothetical protein
MFKKAPPTGVREKGEASRPKRQKALRVRRLCRWFGFAFCLEVR